jgi:hypothetical protein
MTSSAVRRPAGPAQYTPLAVWAMLAAATVYVLAFNPTDRLADPTGPCLWHALFGIDGPTCGGTRMYLVPGPRQPGPGRPPPSGRAGRHAGSALRPRCVDRRVEFGRLLPQLRIRRSAYVTYVAFFLICAVVLRNLPWAPFTWFYVSNPV